MDEQLIHFTSSILEKRKVTEEDTDKLRNLLFAYGMTQQKGNLLFKIKNSLTPEYVTSNFRDLFVDAITSLMLDSEDAPGEISSENAKWLRAKIQYKGNPDVCDKALLESLRMKSISYPDLLRFRGGHSRYVDKLLYGSRYLSLMAVIGSIVSAIILFLKGIVVIYEAICKSFHTSEGQSFFENAEYEHLFSGIVSSVDIFLFALALIIFGVGVYELFVAKIDPVERANDSRPSWLKIPTLDDLKSSLGKVILMVLIVSFFKHTLNMTGWDAVSLLYLAIGILLISAALYLTHKSPEKHKD